MKNVTISLDEDTAVWARVEAAKAGKSLSRYLADLLTERRRGLQPEPLRILQEFLEGSGVPGIAKDMPKRDELYAEREDELVRRYQHSGLHDRPDGT
jgi:hypothetical protein